MAKESLSVDDAVRRMSLPLEEPEQATPPEEEKQAEDVTTELEEEHPETASESEATEEQAEAPSEVAESVEEEEEQAETVEEEIPQLASDDEEVEITVNGTPLKTTVGDLKASYFRQADYTRKTQDLSALQKETMERLNHYVTMLDGLSPDLEAQLTPELRETDPDTYIKVQERVQLLKEEKAEAEERRRQDSLREIEEKRVEAQRLVRSPEMVPEWIDEDTFQRETAEMVDFYSKRGVTADELVMVSTNAQAMQWMREAWLYRKLQDGQTQIASKKIKKAPRHIKGSASRAQEESPEDRAVREARERLQSRSYKRGEGVDAAVAYLAAKKRAASRGQ